MTRGPGAGALPTPVSADSALDFHFPNRSGDQYIAVSGSVQTDKTMESMQEIMREYQDYISTRPATDVEV